MVEFPPLPPSNMVERNETKSSPICTSSNSAELCVEMEKTVDSSELHPVM